MSKYKIINKAIQFPPGFEFKLTKDQRRRRENSLKNTAKGRVEATSMVTFKVGEVVEIYPPKGHDLKWASDRLEPISAQKKPAENNGNAQSQTTETSSGDNTQDTKADEEK